ncbi:hypothetical protein RSAG8_12683, partial [Rhizoctonia solani AG-8 WAC10335]
MAWCDTYYYYPIFTTYRNDVPLSAESGILEALHIHDMYYAYANLHNNHLSPYSECHPDPLKCCIHQYPNVKVFTWLEGEPQWYLGLDLCHALHGTYHHSLQVFGDVLQPANWNWHEPWASYNFEVQLAHLGMLYIPKPTFFQPGVYHLPFQTFKDLQHKVHHNNFYAMCITISGIILGKLLRHM